MSRLFGFVGRWKWTITMTVVFTGLTAVLIVVNPLWCWAPFTWAAVTMWAMRPR